MALFQVDGWDLKATEVKIGGKSKKNNKKRKNQDQDEISSNVLKTDEEPEPKPKKNKKADKNFKKAETNQLKREIPIHESRPEAPQQLFPTLAKLTPLQQKMMAKLTGSRFRWINEQLYTITSDEALKLVQEQPSLFDEYHDGFRSQVQSWPENPVDVFVNQVKERSLKNVNAPGGLPGHRDKSVVIADMGCGEAQFALDVENYLKEKPKKGKKQRATDIKVHSFDLKKANDRITVADIRHVPLEDDSCNIVIFCLALMGTNFLDFINEAYRILAPRGELWIAEIKSRFGERDGKGDEFVNALKLMGFFHKQTDDENKMFTRFEFFKPSSDVLQEREAKLQRKMKFIEQEDDKEQLHKKRQKLPEGKWLLKPCIYKRR
jgi:ribosomal RNA-processing protein 8